MDGAPSICGGFMFERNSDHEAFAAQEHDGWIGCFVNKNGELATAARW